MRHNTDDLLEGLFEWEFTIGDVTNAAEALACVLETAFKHKRLGKVRESAQLLAQVLDPLPLG